MKARGNLSLKRRAGEAIVIAPDSVDRRHIDLRCETNILIRVIRIREGEVTLVIEAPKDFPIIREEIIPGIAS